MKILKKINYKFKKYNVGDTKEIDMGTYGTHTLRIANKSTPSECSTEGFSQTACGFVLEFQDIITTSKMKYFLITSILYSYFDTLSITKYQNKISFFILIFLP